MSDIIFLNSFWSFSKKHIQIKWITMQENIYCSYLCNILFVLFSYYYTWLSSLVFSSFPCETYVYTFGHFGNNEVQGWKKWFQEVTSGVTKNSPMLGQCPKVSKYFSGIWAESYNFILFFAWCPGKTKRYPGSRI